MSRTRFLFPIFGPTAIPADDFVVLVLDVIASEKAHPAGTAALGRTPALGTPALGTGQIVEVFDCNTPSQELRGLIGTGQIDPRGA
jgi:hypothetical protein